MIATIHTIIDFNPGQGGMARTDADYQVRVLDSQSSSATPYELLFMALGSCLYSTFEDVFQKKRLNCDSVSIDISGEKRNEVPMFLKECRIRFTVKAADKEGGFIKSFELACKYCSIFQTLKHVAEMKPEIVFE